MHITVREFRWIDKNLHGMPWRIRHSFWIGAQRQHGFECEALLATRGQREPSAADLARIREMAIATIQRLKTIRKAAKRLTITFHVEQ